MTKMVLRLSVILFLAGSNASHAQNLTEHQLKSAFLYNFAKFVEWPSLAGNDTQALIIGILGEDPFGHDIDEVINGKTANGRRLLVKRFASLRDVSPCHILFVSSSQKQNLKQIVGLAVGLGALTVGETDQFVEIGGVIQMKMIDSKVRLIINQAAAERSGLRISSKLLSLAQVIRK